jgi:hypothetical protein
MNKKEQLLAQLLELEAEPTGEPEQAEAEPPKKDSLWNYELPADWVPPVRYQSEPEPGSDPASFKIGDWWVDSRTGKKERRQAICHPRFPNPGAVLTKEIDREYWEEWDLWLSASMRLELCIMFTAARLRGYRYNRYIDTWEDSDEKKTFDENWAWLCGMWQSRGMTAPTTEDLERWTREWK